MARHSFQRDLRDIHFVLFEHLHAEKVLAYEVFRDFSMDDFRMVLDEALKVAREVLGPANQEGDREGVTYGEGAAKVPASFHHCWRVLAENGWISVFCNPEFGGQGLPYAIATAVNDLFTGANLAMMIYPILAVGNGRLIENFGTDEDRSLFVRKMYTGAWGGTMCLTEPDAGSDVGWLRTRAVPDPDSKDPRIYRIEGTKRFITSGEQDLTENIIHLVLARIEGAPSGTKGVSLFIVPKIWVHPDGSLGEPNDVYCTGVEHKMGIRGSATCSLSFGENGRCRGILLGEPHSGMAKMFQMMNESRLNTGVMGMSVAATAYDAARQYARERVQGPAFTHPRGDRVPIIQHEDVRRMLMNLKAGTEAMRAMILKVALLIDISERDGDERARKTAHQQVDMLTPVVKAYCSDFGFHLIRDAVQVLGGVGFCSEFPVEQYLRDSKINSIWEGTSYIQALDLVGRKLPMDGGQVFRNWLQRVMDFTSTYETDNEFGTDIHLLLEAAKALGEMATAYPHHLQEGKARLVPLTATRFLECFAEVELGHLMLEQGLIARDKLQGISPESPDGIFYRGKMASTHYFIRNILVNVFSRHMAFRQEDTSALDIPDEAF